MLDNQYTERMEKFNIFKVVVIILSLLLIYNYFHKPASIIVRINDPKFSLLGPYNSTQYETDDIYDQLIDIKNFSFKINPQPCHGYTAGLLLIIIITSDPKNYEKRTLIRNTWGRSVDSTKVVFLMGESDNVKMSRTIDEESQKYGDIVQGSFIDAYRNMTYKHVMGLKWVSHHCPTAKYVLKTDDDVVVNSHALRTFLARVSINQSYISILLHPTETTPWGAKGLITCHLMKWAQVQRSKGSKWRVSEEEYTGQFYPDYCLGWAILYSQDVVPKLLATAQTIPYFWIDDVHITGVVAQKVGITRNSLGSLILSQRQAGYLTSLGPKYAGPFLFGPPNLSTRRISEIWKAIPI